MRRRLDFALSLGFCVLLASSGAWFLISTPLTYAASQPPQTKLSGHPQGAALDYANHDIYIANNNGYVLVFDPSSGTIVKNITTRGSLSYIAYDNATTNLYAANTTSIVVISGSSNSVVGSIKTGTFVPYGVAAGVGEVFVTGSAPTSGMVEVLNTRTGTIAATVDVPAAFVGTPAYDSKDNLLYVPDYQTSSGYGNTTSVIDLATDRVVASIFVPNGPFYAAYGFGKVYVAEGGGSQVAVIDPSTNKVVASLSVGSAPDGIAFAGDPLIAVSSYGSTGLGTTNFIDPFTDEPVGYVQTPNGPQLVIFDWYLGEFFVVQYDGFLQGYLAAAFQTSSTTTGARSTSSSSSTYSTPSEVIPVGETTTLSTVEINPQQQAPIPVFPFQPALVVILTVVLLAYYFVARKGTFGRTLLARL